jgi:probable F420-dependent oxidoreductase
MPRIGRLGIWRRHQPGPGIVPELEALGYEALWLGSSPSLGQVRPYLEASEEITIATGILNIWQHEPADVAAQHAELTRDFPGSFLLGIGVGHPEAHTEYKKPYDALSDYLTELDQHGVPKDRVVVAALGPQVLKLSARRSAGAHPYLTTPEHTAQARELIGAEAFLAPEHKVVLTTDAEKARATGRKALEIYLNLANYLNNWKRLGFTDADVAKPGSDALVDAVIAYGTTDAIAARLTEHLTAGADHVPVQVLAGTDKLVPALTELAGPLGLQ